jgi:hypothetical protein
MPDAAYTLAAVSKTSSSSRPRRHVSSRHASVIRQRGHRSASVLYAAATQHRAMYAFAAAKKVATLCQNTLAHHATEGAADVSR